VPDATQRILSAAAEVFAE